MSVRIRNLCFIYLWFVLGVLLYVAGVTLIPLVQESPAAVLGVAGLCVSAGSWLIIFFTGRMIRFGESSGILQNHLAISRYLAPGTYTIKETHRLAAWARWDKWLILFVHQDHPDQVHAMRTDFEPPACATGVILTPAPSSVGGFVVSYTCLTAEDLAILEDCELTLGE